MANTPFKMKGFSGFGNSPNKFNLFGGAIGAIGSLFGKRDDTDMATEKQGKNTRLIEALKKEDEVGVEVEELKKSKDTDISSGINI